MRTARTSLATPRTNPPSASTRPTATRWRSAGANLTVSLPISGRAAGLTRATAALPGRSPETLQNKFSGAIQCCYPIAGTLFLPQSDRGFSFDDIWRSSVAANPGLRLAPATGGDKQWFTIDTTNSTGHGFQYQSWSTGGNNYGGRQFSRSTDGGLTWLDPIFIPNTPSLGTLDVDSNGNLFIGGVDIQPWPDLVRALDEREKWRPSRRASTKAPPSTWTATSRSRADQSRRIGWADFPGGRSLGHKSRTTMFTCWPASFRCRHCAK